MERRKKISLHPLPYREALRDLLKVKPEAKPPKKMAKGRKKVTKSTARP
jgi:hypothetical protein